MAASTMVVVHLGQGALVGVPFRTIDVALRDMVVTAGAIPSGGKNDEKRTHAINSKARVTPALIIQAAG
jgi:hypothetical protein